MPESFNLIIEDDEGKRSVVPVELGEVSIGRLEGNTIRLDERNVSRSHARLSRENGTVYAEDLDSFNGIFINGDRVSGRTPVFSGDLIKIGDFQLAVEGDLPLRDQEPTKKTMVPGLETTEPDIRMGEDADVAIETAEVESQEVAAEAVPEESRAEATAIIHLDQVEDDSAGPRRSDAIAGQRAKLVCVSSNLAGSELEIPRTESVVGRTEENDVVIDHRSVSRNHAKILLHNNAYRVVDLGSANGTLVNGEQYAQVDLKAGDLVEFGHVKFRFVPPGERYEFTEQERALFRSAPDRSTAELDLRAPRRGVGFLRDNPWMTLVVLALSVGSAASLVWWLGLGSDVAPVEELAASATTTAEATEPKSAPDLGALLDRARQAIEERDWPRASRRVKQVLQIQPSHPEALRLEEVAEREGAAAAFYAAANDAIKQGRWADAWNALGEIGEDSHYNEQANPLREQVRGALVSEMLGEARDAITEKDWVRASDLVDEVEGLDPARLEPVDLRKRIAEGRAPPPPPKANKPRPARRPTPRVARVEAPPKPTPPKPAAPTAEPPADAKMLYMRGIQALNSGRMQDSITLFSKCVQVDRSFCFCYRALGIAYARTGNGPKAARYYKLYLKVCPTASDADDVRKLLKNYGG